MLSHNASAAAMVIGWAVTICCPGHALSRLPALRLEELRNMGSAWDLVAGSDIEGFHDRDQDGEDQRQRRKMVNGGDGRLLSSQHKRLQI
jgi:hypothetical protein